MPLNHPRIAASPWLTPETASEFPYYEDTIHRLEAVLDLAQQANKVSDQEIAAILATLHARAIVRLKPNETQAAHCASVLYETILAMMADGAS